MVISMFSAAASLVVKRRQCSHFGESEVFAGLHSGDVGNFPLYIPLYRMKALGGFLWKDMIS